MVYVLGAAKRVRADGGIDLHVLVTFYCDGHLRSYLLDLVFEVLEARLPITGVLQSCLWIA